MVRVSNVQRGALSPVSFISLVSAQAGEWYVPLRTPEVRDSISPACCFQLLFFFSYHGDKDTQRSCNNEMHSTCAALYSFRLSLHQITSPALYRARSFDRGTATSAIFLATLGLSMSMFSLKQMQSSHQRRLRRLH